MKAPCKGCQERAVGCHGSCERYKAFRIAYDAAKAALDGKVEDNSMIGDTIARGIRKRKKKYHMK